MNLDKTKQYGIICFSRKNNLVNLAIKLKGQQRLKNFGVNKKLSEIPTHSAMLIYENGLWWVYQSHWNSGVHKLTWESFLYEKNSELIFYEDKFNVETMKELLRKPYGKLDMLAFCNDFIINVFKKDYKSFIHKADTGYFCSEYVAICQNGIGIAKFLKLPCYVIEPATHWYWADSMGLLKK